MGAGNSQNPKLCCYSERGRPPARITETAFVDYEETDHDWVSSTELPKRVYRPKRAIISDPDPTYMPARQKGKSRSYVLSGPPDLEWKNSASSSESEQPEFWANSASEDFADTSRDPDVMARERGLRPILDVRRSLNETIVELRAEHVTRAQMDEETTPEDESTADASAEDAGGDASAEDAVGEYGLRDFVRTPPIPGQRQPEPSQQTPEQRSVTSLESDAALRPPIYQGKRPSHSIAAHPVLSGDAPTSQSPPSRFADPPDELKPTAPVILDRLWNAAADPSDHPDAPLAPPQDRRSSPGHPAKRRPSYPPSLSDPVQPNTQGASTDQRQSEKRAEKFPHRASIPSLDLAISEALIKEKFRIADQPEGGISPEKLEAAVSPSRKSRSPSPSDEDGDPPRHRSWLLNQRPRSRSLSPRKHSLRRRRRRPRPWDDVDTDNRAFFYDKPQQKRLRSSPLFFFSEQPKGTGPRRMTISGKRPIAATAEHQKELMEALTSAMPKSLNKPEMLLDRMQKIWADVTFSDTYGNLLLNDSKFRKEVAWLSARKSKRHKIVPFQEMYQALASSALQATQQRDQPSQRVSRARSLPGTPRTPSRKSRSPRRQTVVLGKSPKRKPATAPSSPILGAPPSPNKFRHPDDQQLLGPPPTSME